jgi:hypothetical protein
MVHELYPYVGWVTDVIIGGVVVLVLSLALWITIRGR